MLSEQSKVLKTYEPFILGRCQCPCSTEIDIISLRKGRKTGYLRKYVDKTHTLRARNQTGENNNQWKGGQPTQDKDGYWLIYKPEHPHRNSRNKVFLHRLIYENYLSIMLDEEVYLNKEEQIHHINKDKEDNSLINLQYMATVQDHMKEHRQLYDGVRCKKCGSETTGIRKDNGRPRWIPDKNGEGYFCESCDKQRYYLENKDKRKKYEQDNRDRILKKQKEYNNTKRKGRGKNK